MKQVLAALKLVLADIAGLQTVTKAAAVAAIVVPIAASIAGAHLTVAEVTGWLAIAGGVAAALEKVTSGQAKAAVKK
jgi:hypothetical protein